jgi:SAM-dependent methyltransferase
MNQLNEFLSLLNEGVEENTFVRLTLSKNRDKNSTLKKVIIKLAEIKKRLQFSVVYRHNRKDITKNFDLKEGKTIIENLLKESFQIANLFTINHDFILEVKGESGRIKTQKPTFKTLPNKSHDNSKTIQITKTNYLVELGILDKGGRIQKDKGDKYKQIRKFIEIIDGLTQKNAQLKSKSQVKIFDMGSGKGYLTFALYDYLTNNAQLKTDITGVEIREDLIAFCNKTAQKVGFDHLSFEKGFISDYDLSNADILIALHACDTATDDAIFKGIQAGAELIICAPCCHKQIRKQMNATPPLNNITQFGILKERQAEIVTDTIRALLLEESGYKTKVFEFISSEHTGKNVMIVAERKNAQSNSEEYLEKIKDLKAQFGIEFHYLERLLGLG